MSGRSARCEFFPLGAVLDRLGVVRGVWSLAETGKYCGLPLVPTATSGFGAKVRTRLPPGRCWGWFQPGDLRAAERYGRDLIADIELRGTNKVRPDAGWTGREVAEATAAAAYCGGVTSHGFALKPLRPVLLQFAREGLPAYPQIYDSDKSTRDPRQFINDCVGQYRALGFADVRPLIGLSAGPERVAVWLDECQRQGWHPDLWSLARAREMNLCAGGVIDAPLPPRPLPPRPLPPPLPDLPDLSPYPLPRASDGTPGGFVLLLVVAGLLYGLTRAKAKP